jgi:hypothetical protein
MDIKTPFNADTIPILKELNYGFPSIVGVEWNQSTDTWTRIDAMGNHMTSFSPNFDTVEPWRSIRRVTLATNGRITGVGDGKGTGLTLDGSTGRVMVQIPKFYTKGIRSAANTYRWWVSPVSREGFEVHPAFLQRGGTERDFIYVGAYEAAIGYTSHTSSTKLLQSRTGVQPYTGNADSIWEVPFTAGDNEPIIGDELGTPTEGGFYLVDYHVTSGSWVGNDAAGKLLIRKPGDATCGWTNTETITNTSQSNTLGTAGTPVGETATIGTMRTLAGNVGGSWGQVGIWSLAAIRLLFYVEYAGASSQTLIGKGIVDKASGTGFAGGLTGANSIDSNLATNGTGTGTGTNGLTPIAYRGIENLWGNIWTFIDGYNAVDAEYRIINRDGSGTFADALAGGDYEASLAIPITSDGYQSNIEWEDLLKFAIVPKAVAGSSSTYLYDYFYAHDAGETNILLFGGGWDYGLSAGVAYLDSSNVASYCTRYIGGRLEFIG